MVLMVIDLLPLGDGNQVSCRSAFPVRSLPRPNENLDYDVALPILTERSAENIGLEASPSFDDFGSSLGKPIDLSEHPNALPVSRNAWHPWVFATFYPYA